MRRLALRGQDAGTVVDLASGTTTELAGPLRLDPPRRQITGNAAWTWDGHLFVRVVDYGDRGPPYVNGAVSLHRVHAPTGAVGLRRTY